LSDQPNSKKLKQVILGAFGLITLFAFQNCSTTPSENQVQNDEKIEAEPQTTSQIKIKNNQNSFEFGAIRLVSKQESVASVFNVAKK